MEATPKTVELEAVEVVPYVEEEGEDSNFSTRRKSKIKQIEDVADEALSIELEAAVESETVDVEPIVEEEEDSNFSMKRKQKKRQVEDVEAAALSMKIEQELEPSLEEEIDIIPLVNKRQIIDEGDFDFTVTSSRPGSAMGYAELSYPLEKIIERQFSVYELEEMATRREIIRFDTEIELLDESEVSATTEQEIIDISTSNQEHEQTNVKEIVEECELSIQMREEVTEEAILRKRKAMAREESVVSATATETHSRSEPIVEEEEDSNFSMKRKQKKAQVGDVEGAALSMKIEQEVERETLIEEEVIIEKKTKRHIIDEGDFYFTVKSRRPGPGRSDEAYAELYIFIETIVTVTEIERSSTMSEQSSRYEQLIATRDESFQNTSETFYYLHPSETIETTYTIHTSTRLEEFKYILSIRNSTIVDPSSF